MTAGIRTDRWKFLDEGKMRKVSNRLFADSTTRLGIVTLACGLICFISPLRVKSALSRSLKHTDEPRRTAFTSNVSRSKFRYINVGASQRLQASDKQYTANRALAILIDKFPKSMAA